MRIVISGTVGVGKSTISELLEKKLIEKGYKVSFLREETVKSIYLDYYYKSPTDWAFIAQLDFLLGRFKQWLVDENKREKYENPDNYITIYDRHFLDDYVFAELHTIKQNISSFNSITYHVVYKELLEKMLKMNARPDYFILLSAPLDIILNRLNSRGREEEIKVNNEYWSDLYDNYYKRPMFQNHFKNNTKNFIELLTKDKNPDQIVDDIIQKIGK